MPEKRFSNTTYDQWLLLSLDVNVESLLLRNKKREIVDSILKNCKNNTNIRDRIGLFGILMLYLPRIWRFSSRKQLTV